MMQSSVDKQQSSQSINRGPRPLRSDLISLSDDIFGFVESRRSQIRKKGGGTDVLDNSISRYRMSVRLASIHRIRGGCIFRNRIVAALECIFRFALLLHPFRSLHTRTTILYPYKIVHQRPHIINKLCEYDTDCMTRAPTQAPTSFSFSLRALLLHEKTLHQDRQ